MRPVSTARTASSGRGRQYRGHDDHDPGEEEAVDRNDTVEDGDGVGGKHRRRRLQAVAEDDDHPRLQHQQQTE